jgi:4-hydroxybenzoate polyprenyltransferase
MLVLLTALYFAANDLGTIYLLGIVAVAALLTYEHWLVRPDDLSRVNQAFFQVNGVISVGLFVVVVVQIVVGV